MISGFVSERCHALVLLCLGLCLATTAGAATGGHGTEQNAEQPADLPHIVLVTVDTLRADRLSVYGNPRPTSPNIDALLARGARFDAARTVEPLTAPAFASVLTSLYPHEHGASRNGIPIREGLRSLPGILKQLGYKTAAFVSNWTLKDEQSGLAEYFDAYEEVLTRKRWLFWFGEADADDVRARTLDWLENEGSATGQPVFMWVHFIEPHAPYKLYEEFADRLDLPSDGSASDRQRYDTEIAAVDHQIGFLLEDLDAQLDLDRTLLIFASDHGEGLGEHGYKGHGRHLYEEELRIPLGFTWGDRIPQAVYRAPATVLDIAPTVIGLLGAPAPPEWQGRDWSEALFTATDGPMDRVTYYQAHKGAVKGSTEDEDVAARKRQRGLIRLAIVKGRNKQVLDLEKGTLTSYRLPGIVTGNGLRYAGSESGTQPASDSPETLSEAMEKWRTLVNQELLERDRSLPPPMSDEAIEELKSLGYTN